MSIDRPSWVPGRYGNALRFNPKDGVRLATTTLSELPPPWTAVFWVKREAASEAASLFSSNKHALKLEQWKNTHEVGITAFGRFDRAFGYRAPIGAWVQLTLVGAAAETRLYADGVLQGTLEEPLRLGMRWLGSTQGYVELASMIIDEIQVFDQALTDAQVAELADEKPANPGGAGIPNDLSVTIGSTTLASGGTYDAGGFTLPMQPKDIAVTIHNNTGGVVSLPDTPPVTLDDPGAGFSVASQPSSPILPGQSGTLGLRFSPASAGTRSTVVRFRNTSQRRDPFTFTVTAEARAGARSREQSISCSATLKAIVRPDGTLWIKAGSGNWGKVALPQSCKVVAVDTWRTCFAFLTDTGELKVHNLSWQDPSLMQSLLDGCLLFSMDPYTDTIGAASALLTTASVIAIKSDGSLFAPGHADQGGGSADGTFTLPDTVMVQRGQMFSMALRKDGTVRCWGNNLDYQCGGVSNDIMIRPGKVAGLDDVVHISASRSNNPFCLAVRADGTVWGWGLDQGCLGVARAGHQIGPAQIQGLSNIRSVFAGYSQGEAFAVDRDGNLWSWGYSNGGNGVGTLGRTNAPPGSIHAPDVVPGVRNVVSVSFDGQGALILTADGTPYWFGANPPAASSVTPVRMDEFTGGDW